MCLSEIIIFEGVCHLINNHLGLIFSFIFVIPKYSN